MLKPVLEFNKLRNGFKYDKDLEIKMFNEEVKEFFDGKDVADRVDALVDTNYVATGTTMKLMYNGLHPVDDMPYEFEKTIDFMKGIIYEELGGLTQQVLAEASRIVCEINAEKSNRLDKNGKVIKQANLRNATEEIRAFINQLIDKQNQKDENEE